MLQKERQFEFDGIRYSVGKLNGFEQFHIFRRVLPLITNLGSSLFAVLAGKVDVTNFSKLDWFVYCTPMLDELAKMPQADVDYVMQSAMKVVHRQEGERFVPIANAGGLILFDDLEMTGLLRILLEVMQHNFSGFFPAPQTSPDSPADAPASM